MEVAAVIFREESQLENLHDHLQGEKEQGKEQQPQENSKEPLEQNQLPQLISNFSHLCLFLLVGPAKPLWSLAPAVSANSGL